MNKRFIKILPVVSCIILATTSCESDNDSFQSSSGTDANSGTISQKNFSVLTADLNPAVLDETANTFTKTSVEITASIGDRNNQVLTDSHTINFVAEYGLIEPTCVTENGECSVTWTAIKFPEPGGPGSDGITTITAYATGEEGFTDTNGNTIFDDGDAGFDDLEEPFVDSDESGGFTAGDQVIDVKSTNDPTGENLTHDIADGFFNGSGCTHSSLCADRKSVSVFARVSMNLVVNELPKTIGGTVTGLDPISSGVVLQNNGGDDLTIIADGDYTFDTGIEAGQTYAVTVLTNPTLPTQTCTPTNATGIASANVTNVDITCATDTFAVGGTVTGLPIGDTITVVNNNDGITLVINGGAGSIPYTFVDEVADLGPYNIIITVGPTTGGLTCAFAPPASSSGNLDGADITDAHIVCL